MKSIPHSDNTTSEIKSRAKKTAITIHARGNAFLTATCRPLVCFTFAYPSTHSFILPRDEPISHAISRICSHQPQSNLWVVSAGVST
ncbi:hypothetical protein CEXT_361161 [Caerostris extrusa]|uniref:Uncharacterized protein n=1 Tax=Caerostris extrusa TaxID=172846 RepID=A0AAV4X201_CAEEX|nr:hypothetical protein CEXT_361161 [Caerostris extrusa]